MKTFLTNRRWNLFIAIASLTGLVASIYWILIYRDTDRFKIFIRLLWVIFFGISAFIYSRKYLKESRQ